MDALLKSLSELAPVLLLAVGALALILLAVVAMLSKRLKAMEARWNSLLREASGSNMERLLQDHFDERRALIAEHAETRERVEILEQKMEGSKRHLGLVRYDAFDDVGGSQSFALAVYDDRGDGAVVTSLVGRADCRVYAKPLTRGRSDRTLSQEEQRAIDDARRSSPKPLIAP